MKPPFKSQSKSNIWLGPISGRQVTITEFNSPSARFHRLTNIEIKSIFSDVSFDCDFPERKIGVVELE
jgi:hypothetical protein